MLQCDVTSGVLANITYIGSGLHRMCYIDCVMSPVVHILWRGLHIVVWQALSSSGSARHKCGSGKYYNIRGICLLKKCVSSALKILFK